MKMGFVARRCGRGARITSAAITLAVAVPAVASANPPTTMPPTANGHAYRHGAVPLRGSKNANAATSSSASNLNYGGGISNGSQTVGVETGAEKVYIVFWGSQWGTQGTGSNGNLTLSGDPSGMAPYLQQFVKGLGTNNETWSGVLTQFCQGVATGAQTCPSGSTQHVGYPTGGAYAGVWVDESSAAPSQANGNQLAGEAVRAATHFGNTTQASNLNAQYLIVSPTGTHPDGYNTVTGQFCAWHDYTADTTLSGGAVSSPDGYLAFTNLPYIPDMGASCGQNFVNAGSAGNLDGVSIVEGHEYAETATDTYPAGGYTDSTGYENGDKCAWNPSGQTVKSQNVTFATGSFAMQPTWGNDGNGGAGACQISHAIITNGGGGTANTVTVTSPGNQTGTVGTAASLQIKASDSASGQTLTYSAAGLPPGLSISSTSGLISGTPTTAGTFPVTVTAKDTSNASGSTSFTWTVNAASGGGGCAAKQILGNPGFESGTAAPWSATSGVLSSTSSGQPSHSGTYFAWLDGYGSSHTDTLSQSVAVPAGCANYALSFWLHIDTAETTTTAAYDKLTVQVLNSSGAVLGTLGTFSNLNHAAGYQQHSFSMAAYAGQTVTLRFTGTEDASLQTSFCIDDTALNVS